MFKPRRLGQLSKNNQGQTVNVLVKQAVPDFKRRDYSEEGRKVTVPSKPPLPPGAASPAKSQKKVVSHPSKADILVPKMAEGKTKDGKSSEPSNPNEWKRVNLTEITYGDATHATNESTMAGTTMRKSMSEGTSLHQGKTMQDSRS